MNPQSKPVRGQMFQRVLVGLDGSEESERSIPWVRFLAPHAELILGRIVESVGAGSPFVDTFSMGYVIDHGERYLEEVAERLAPRPHTEVRFGSLADGQLSMARERGCDLISVTTRGGSRLWRRLLGGATERLLHNSEFPVLTVPAWGAAREPRGLARIAVPLDGTPETEVILPIVAGLALREQALVYLIRYSPVERPTPDPSAITSRLDALAQRFRSQGVRASVIAGGDHRPEALVEAIADTGSEILAMGVRGHGALRHLVSGGLPSRIIQQAPVPVMVLRHDARIIAGRELSFLHPSSTEGVRP